MLGENFIPSDSRTETTSHVRQLYERGITTIAIDGGDGTVSTALTAIARAYPADKLPDIAVLPSGNSNLIAGDVGFGLRGIEALDRLNKGAMRSSMRTPIRLSWPDTDRNLYSVCLVAVQVLRVLSVLLTRQMLFALRRMTLLWPQPSFRHVQSFVSV